MQSGTNVAKDLKAREFGQEIVNNAATGRQIFHVRLPSSFFDRQQTEDRTPGPQDLSATTNTLVSDDLFAKDLRNKIDQAVQDVIIASRIVDGFKDGQQIAHLKNHAQFPLEWVPPSAVGFDRIGRLFRTPRYHSLICAACVDSSLGLPSRWPSAFSGIV